MSRAGDIHMTRAADTTPLRTRETGAETLGSGSYPAWRGGEEEKRAELDCRSM